MFYTEDVLNNTLLVIVIAEILLPYIANKFPLDSKMANFIIVRSLIKTRN